MAVTLTPQYAHKKLVAIGNDKVEYENVAGSFTELTAASGDIDTTDQLNAVEAFQKVFIANGANLKIIDFINTKLDLGAGNELTTAPNVGSILTQATSGAQMIVNSVDSTKRYIYGYTTTTATFNTANTVTDGDGNMDPASFTPAVVSEATTTPHWYSWEVFPDSASGSLPAKSYLIALYRGRLVLAGNPNDPFQWYMSRQNDHTDFAYAANDAQSPVAGANANAGKVGDIIRALIPYEDDYFFFGCASSIWYMQGDPAVGGSLNILDAKRGVFGDRSWCYDGNNGLWLWTTDGICRIPVSKSGVGPLENKTVNKLPKLLEDAGADPSSHQITMGYNKKLNVIIIMVTKLSDGSNTGFWYDPKVDGFFPITLPDVCGAYSMFYYDANDPDYADLLIGCKDGYVRKFDPTAKSDDIGATDQAIDSEVLMPVVPLSQDADVEGVLRSTTFITSGSSSGTTFQDTDSVDYEIFVGDDAEDVVEQVRDGDTALQSGTITGTGRSNRVRKRARGHNLGIKLSNDTADETWSLEKIQIEYDEKGRIK